MINQFASDFDIAETISDGNLDEYSLFHYGVNILKADRKKEIKGSEFSC
jgi:hypothetical protein